MLSDLGLLSVTSATRNAGRNVITFLYFASKAEWETWRMETVGDMDTDIDVSVDVMDRVKVLK